MDTGIFEKLTLEFLKNGHWTLAILKNGHWTLDPPFHTPTDVVLNGVRYIRAPDDYKYNTIATKVLKI